MLTERRTPPTTDEQPSHGWDETRFWVGTLGVFVTTFVLALVVSTFVLTVAFGYRPIAVVSGSMEPGISVGDVVLYERHELSDIEEGRIIVFDDPTIDGGTIIHRVVDTDPDTGWLRTRGDANNSNDSGWVTEDDIKGVGRVLIPFVGIPAAWVQTGRPIAAIAVVAFILFAAWTARWGWHRRYDPWAQIVASNAGGHDAADATAMTISGIELLAAALLKISAPLGLRTQVGHRRGTVSVLSMSQEVEALLHRTADPAALDDVDAVLRHMAAGLVTAKPAPVIVGLAITADRINIILKEPHPNPPAPFVVGSNKHSWDVDRDVGIEHAIDLGVAPMPGLVTIGHTPRSLVVIDLEQAGVVNLAGPPDEIMATMETMALELAVSPLADTIEILCVNFGHQLAGFERVTVVDDIVDAADLIATHDADAAELAAAAGMSPLEVRVREIGGNAWAPVVVFAPNSNHAAAIAAAANHTPAAGVTAVVTGDTAAIWQMRLSQGQIEIPHVSMTLLRRNLTADELAVACSLVGSAQIPLVGEVPDTVADPAAEKAAAEKAAVDEVAAEKAAAKAAAEAQKAAAAKAAAEPQKAAAEKAVAETQKAAAAKAAAEAQKAAAAKAAAERAAAEAQKAAAAKAAAETQKAAAAKAAADKVVAERAAAEAQKAAAAKAAAAHLTGMYAEAIVAINDMYAEAIVAINEATHA